MSRLVRRLAAALMASLLLGPVALARADVNFLLAAGQPGSISYELGVGLSTLIKIVLLPSDGIDLTIVETTAEGEASLLLVADRAQLALVPMQKVASGEFSDDVRRILAFWSDEQSDEVPLELLVRAEVSDDVTYRVVQTIFENGTFLEHTQERSWKFSIDRALAGSHLPLHPGAIRYYSERGVPDLATVTRQRKTSNTPPASARHHGDATFFLYFGVGEAELDEPAKRQLAAACKHAEASKSRDIHVVGYASSSKRDGDSERLALQRSVSVSVALSKDDRCQGLIEIVDSADVKSPLPNGLSTGSNDRVEVTVISAR